MAQYAPDRYPQQWPARQAKLDPPPAQTTPDVMRPEGGSWVSSVTRLTTKHQITIPMEVRRALGLQADDQVEFAVEGSTVTLRKAEPYRSDDLVFRLVKAHAMRDPRCA
jgi:AbrB family looped-hinge helix DNA binding protein